MNLIAAVDKNWAIGCKNKLLVSIPADMKFFRETTTGKVVVMGRKTLESFPNGQPLKKRVNIVLTHDKNFKAGDAIIVHSMEELREELKKSNPALYLRLRWGFLGQGMNLPGKGGRSLSIAGYKIAQKFFGFN